MKEVVTYEGLRSLVSNRHQLGVHAFTLLSQLSALANSEDPIDNQNARDLTIRLLERRAEFTRQQRNILTSLVRAQGLFPYLDPRELRTADLIAYETHRPFGLEDDSIVFHRVQGAIYFQLLDGKSIVLSAPTSFGKSLLIDALLATGRYENVVVVVPTLALIDETRRRISQRFGGRFRIITHPSQQIGRRNVFIYTQERVLDHTAFPAIDLFVIDEFYKLDPSSDVERSTLLNHALYRLLKTSSQFLLIGPSVEGIHQELVDRFNARFIQTNFSTVAIDVEYVQANRSDTDALARLCHSLEEPTLIYCSSPARARKVGVALLEAGLGKEVAALGAAGNWVAEHYHPEWLIGKALGQGLGIHHGKLPRSLARFMVKSFNEGLIRYLVCTSTLIEGVNTVAKNVIIFDNRVASRRFDFFTFNNIRGRSGRMFQHFVGRVFLFHDEPARRLPLVDVPVLSQPDSVPTSLLVQLDPEDLKPQSYERLRPLRSQTDLSWNVLKQNVGISPEHQVSVAAEIRRRAEEVHPLVAWRGFPSWDQLVLTGEFAWTLSGFAGTGRRFGISSGRQLAWKLSTLQRYPQMKDYIRAMAGKNEEAAEWDDVVESALEFVRQWPGHHAPRLFTALDGIQRDVFSSLGLSVGDYSAYVGRMSSLFLPSTLVAVEEYGLPIDTALRIRRHLTVDGTLDDLLDSIRALNVETLPLSDFERAVLSDTRQSLLPDGPVVRQLPLW